MKIIKANLENFPQLRVLDLSENTITRIEGLQSLRDLEQLNLERNNIEKLEGLDFQQRLRKLYLRHNRIRRLEGLKFCMSLQEIQISYQHVGSGNYFTIEEESMIGVSESLLSLEMNDVRCREIMPLQHLRNLLLRRLP